MADIQGWRARREQQTRFNQALRKTIYVKPFNKNDTKYKEKKQ